MTIQEALDRLREALPAGGTVAIIRSLWSRSVVGGGPVIHEKDGDWQVIVTAPNHLDHVEAAFGSDLEMVVGQVLAQWVESRAKLRP